MRGLSEPTASWKIICIDGTTPRKGDATFLSRANKIVPPLAFWSPMSVFAIVDFPDPDSPTMPRISPFASANDPPFTASYEP